MHRRSRPAPFASVEMLEIRQLLASATIGVRAVDSSGNPAADVYRTPPPNFRTGVHFEFVLSGDYTTNGTSYSYNISANPDNAELFRLEGENLVPIAYPGPYHELQDIYVVAAGTTTPIPDVVLTLTLETPVSCFNSTDWTVLPSSAMITIHGTPTAPSPQSPTPQAGNQGRSGPPMTPQAASQGSPGLMSLPSAGTAGGINGFNGAVWVDSVPFSSGGFGQQWGPAIGWSAVSDYSTGGTLGKGFVNASQPTLRRTPNDGYMVVHSATDVQWFDPDGQGGFAAKYFGREKLTVDGAGFKLTDSGGNVAKFFGFGADVPAPQRGKFLASSSRSGNQVTTTYGSGGQLLSESRSSGISLGESSNYSYVGSGINAGRVASVTLARNTGGTPATVRTVEYTYYGANQSFGNAGNLQLERVLDAAGGVIGTTYYRYYTADGSTGYAEGLRYVLRPEAYARLAAAVPDPLTAPDATVATYADNAYEYDSSRRATKSVVAGAGPTGPGQFTYSYTTGSNADGYNAWKSRTVETLPDGNQNLQYFNYAGELILHAFLDLADPADPSLVGKLWATSYRYDAAGRLVQAAQPSAVTITTLAALDAAAAAYADLVGYNSTNETYQHLSANAGVVRVAEYAATTTATAASAGDAAGYLKADRIRRGTGGTPITLDSFLYLSRVDANGAATYPLASATVYSNDDGTGARTTSYAYTWLGSTAQPASIATSLPVVSAAQGGPGTADVATTVYDTYGRPTWVRDEDGYIHHTAYDDGTGAVVKAIVDVDTGQTASFAGLPAGWATRAGGGLHLITTDRVDNQGRPTKRVDPSGSITHWVYKDAQHEVRTYRGWNPANASTTGPIEVSRQDRGLGYDEAFTMAVAPTSTGAVGSFEPAGTETIGSLLTLSRNILDANRRVVETDAYFSMDGLTYSAGVLRPGTAGTNYHATTYGYDVMGRLSRVVDANGTIAATAFDGPGRMSAESVGTADGAGSNMVTVARYQYDAGTVGDGNLTRSTAYPGGGAADRVAEYAYDWRNRLVATKGGVQATESVDVQRQLVYLDLNNLGEVIAVSRYDGDGSIVSATKPAANTLRAYSTTTHDNQGRPYLQKVFSVAQSTGVVSPTGLTSQTYFDHRGNAIAVATSGGPATKYRHDGAGRVVVEATTDAAGGWTWAAAGSTAGDHVLTETRTTYDPAGNPILVATSDRAHDAIGLGTLASPGDGLVATYYAEDNFTGGTVGRLDPVVDFNWGTGRPHPAIEPDTFSATWRGSVEIPTTGLWTFFALVDDGARLWVDDQLMFDDLNPGSTRELSNAVAIALQAGRLYAIRLDYREVSGGASIALKWSGPGTAKQVIPQARLFSTAAFGDGLAATYYAEANLSGGTVSRLDPAVDFNWGNGSPDPAIEPDTFSAMWLGYVEVPTTGTWAFTASVDDGARLWVNGQLIFDDMNPGSTRDVTGSIALQAGRLYAIRLDYVEVGGDAVVALKWAGPGTPQQVIPQARLHSNAAFGDGLAATYYAEDNFTGGTASRIDPAVDFDWGTGRPHPAIEPDTFSVTWMGSVEVPASGLWTFFALVDDGARLWVDNQLMFDDLNPGSTRELSRPTTIALQAGRLYAIRLDYREVSGGASVALKWSGPGTSKQVIPQARLFSTAAPFRVAPPTNRARTSYAAFYYDEADRLTEAVNLGNNAGGVYNRPATPPARSDTALVTSYRYGYDSAQSNLRWVVQATDPRGIHARTTSDALGRPVAVVANASPLPSDPGLPDDIGLVTASANNTTRYTYDGLGQIRTVTAVMPAGTPSQTTTYVRGVTTAAGSAVNSNGLLAAVVQPDQTTGAYPSEANLAAHRVAYTYNALGQVIGMTDAKGTVHEHSYDVLGRPIADAVITLGTGVDGAVQRRETAYDTAGRPYLFTSSNAPTGGAVVNQVRDDFNGLGQLVAEYEEHNGAVNPATSPAVRYAYTEMVGGQDHSRLASMTYPNGRVVRYAYDAGIDSAIGRVSTVAEDNAGAVGAALETYKYLGLGTVVERARPQAGTKLSYLRQPGDANVLDDGNDPYTGLDRFGRIADQNWTRTAATPGGAIGSSTVRLQYRHDRDGNALARRDLVNIALSELYAYDSLNRLTSTKRGVLTAGTTGGPLDTVANPARQQAWTLDALGNWAGVATDGTTTTRQFNAANQATAVSGAAAPAYDTAGNTTAKDGKAYAHDAWNRLVSVKVGATTLAAYAYDALGRRVVETYSGTTTHVYFTPDWQAIEERNGGTGNANVAVQYVLGVTGQVVLRDGYVAGSMVAGSRRFVQQNANGDTMALVSGGDVVERFAYDAYGATTFLDANGTAQPGSASGFRVLFQGGRYDAATGLYLFRHRDLDPTSGAWMQRDPIGLAAGDTNLYRFVTNNPTNFIDPTGLDEGEAAFQVGPGEAAFRAGMALRPKIGRRKMSVAETTYVNNMKVAMAKSLGEIGSGVVPGQTGHRPYPAKLNITDNVLGGPSDEILAVTDFPRLEFYSPRLLGGYVSWPSGAGTKYPHRDMPEYDFAEHGFFTNGGRPNEPGYKTTLFEQFFKSSSNDQLVTLMHESYHANGYWAHPDKFDYAEKWAQEFLAPIVLTTPAWAAFKKDPLTNDLRRRITEEARARDQTTTAK